MMNLESITTSLEMSKKLQEAGFVMDSPYVWVGGEIWDETMQSDYETPATPIRESWIPAYTFQQLLEGIPEKVEIYGDFWHLEITISNKGGYERLYLIKSSRVDGRVKCSTSLFESESTRLPDTAAEAVLWCIQNNYISVGNNE